MTTPARERIPALDVLRGVAVAGILFANVLVFFGLQWGDSARMESAARYYDEVALHELELPAYLEWRQAHDQPEPTPHAAQGLPAQAQASHERAARSSRSLAP